MGGSMHGLLTRSISLAAIVLTLVFYNSTLDSRAKSEEIAQLKAQAQAQQTENAQEGGGYADGTYSGSGQGFGGPISADVTVQDGKITAIDITSHDGEDGSYFSMAEQLTDDIIAAQSTDVDLISGATFSSTGIRDAVSDALEKAVQ